MQIKNVYRLLSWRLTPHDTVILRADCNVPSRDGVIIDDARLVALLPTLQYLMSTGAQIIILTHWNRPKKYDPALSTKSIVTWFNAHNIPMAFCASPGDIDDTPIIMLENIRFLDDATARQWIAQLSDRGTYFIHDGFSVMHRDDPFNTELLVRFAPKNRSLGMSAYREISMLDSFLHHFKRPGLGIFGGAKLASKIDAIETMSHNLSTIALLPALCFSIMRAHDDEIGNSFDDGTSAERIAKFENTLHENNCKLLLPTDFLVSQNGTQPPYITVNSFQQNQTGISFGPQTTAQLLQEIDSARSIIINGVAGFVDIPESLEPFKKILHHIATTKSQTTLIAGGDTAAALDKLGLTQKFPNISLAGSATLAYFAGNKLPGLETL
jgi:3-phosphoglycerate kinase